MVLITTAAPPTPPLPETPLRAYRDALDAVFQNLSQFTTEFLAQHALTGVLATVTNTLETFPDQGPHALADDDYILQEGGAWFTMNTLSVRLHTTDEGIVCDMHVHTKEDTGALASCYAFFNETGEDQTAHEPVEPQCRVALSSFLIRSTVERDEVSGDSLYWSNEDGWVDRESATLFPEKPTILPATGEWEPINTLAPLRQHATPSQPRDSDPSEHWVDLPSPNCITDPDAPMQNVATFTNAKEACAFAQEHFGTDAVGRLCLVTPAPEPPERALIRAGHLAQAALKQRLQHPLITQEEQTAYEALTTALANISE